MSQMNRPPRGGQAPHPCWSAQQKLSAISLSHTWICGCAVSPSSASGNTDCCLPSRLLPDPHFLLLLSQLLRVGAARGPMQRSPERHPDPPQSSVLAAFLSFLPGPPTQYLDTPRSHHLPSRKPSLPPLSLSCCTTLHPPTFPPHAGSPLARQSVF